MQSKSGVIWISITALVAGINLSFFGFQLPISKQIDATEIESFFWPKQKKLTGFEMVNQYNEPFTLPNLTDKWSFLFFGYTHCPDICPITMQTLRQTRSIILENTPSLEAHTQFIFVSVDPERDTPEHMKIYLGFFGDAFLGATGNKQQIESLTTQLGIPYSIAPHEPGDKNYLVEHSGSILLISPQGMLASIYQPPLDPKAMADRFDQIIQFMEQPG
ncbi:MAG: SCO family protein [Gammaproteobacteria bacterium]|nr:SCO family protein [Gammaproteobacteria bacterium]